MFDPAAPGGDVPTFPATMPLAAAVFVVLLQLTLVSEGWPLRRLNRFLAGGAALAAAWAGGVALYEALVRTGTLTGGDFGSVLACIGAVQVVVYVVLGGWPFCTIGPRGARLAAANVSVLGAGCLAFLVLRDGAALAPAAISSGAGSVVAGGLIVGMLFEGWLDGVLAPGPARAGATAAVAGGAAVLYAGLQALAHAAHWTRAEPEDWVAYVTLNAIAVGVIMHVAIGRRWPFAPAA